MRKQQFPIGLVIMFGCMMLVMYFSLGSVVIMDENINSGNVSQPISDAYNFTETSISIGLDFGSYIPILLVCIFLVAICLFYFRKVW